MLLFVFALIIAFAAVRANALQLSSEGKARAVIVADASATEPERNAARELAAYLGRISGGSFEIAEKPGADVNIYIGQTDTVRALVPDFDWQSLESDGILIKSVEDGLILAGDRPRGTLYAVYSFLEDFSGVRYLTPDAETVPENKNIVIPDSIDIAYRPDFFSREVYFGLNMDHPAHAIKLRLNGHHNEIAPEWGGNCELIGFAHTLGRVLLRPEVYFDEHPEWYALRDGKRVPTQPCLSNPEVLDKLAENVRRELDKHDNPRMISITQNDNEAPCQCEKCQAMVKEFGAESGMLINALNHIYDKIKDQYPDVLLETFAYQYTVPAPTGIKPCKNVIIRLCDIENNFGEPVEARSGNGPYRVIENCRIFPYADQQTVNGDFYKNLEAWGNIAHNMFIWNYIVNFNNYYIIHPNFHVLKQDILSFRKNHASAIFEQGDSFNQTPAFNAVKNYLAAHLLWNPDSDDDALIKDFMQNYYGPCWRYLYEIICGCERLITSRRIFLSTYMNDVSWMNTEEMIYFFRLFRLAYDTAEGVYKDRIYNEIMFFQTGWFVADAETRKAVADSGWLLISDEKEFAQRIYEYANSCGNAFYSESKTIDISPYAPKIPFEREYIIGADELLLRKPGSLSCLADDPEASRGRAAATLPAAGVRSMLRNVTDLLCSLHREGIEKIRLSAVCRIAPGSDPDEDALQIELWDPLAGGPLFSRVLKAGEIGGQYSLIELGERTVWPSKGCGLYVHSYKPRVFIDRIIITTVK